MMDAAYGDGGGGGREMRDWEMDVMEDKALEDEDVEQVRQRREAIARWVDTFERWGDAAQEGAIEALLQRQGQDGVRLIYHHIRQHLHVDFLAELPEELAVHVLQYLSPRDLCKCARVSRMWRMVSSLDAIWKPKTVADLAPEKLDLFLSRARQTLPELSAWKEIYALWQRCQIRWRDPGLASRPHTTFRAHTGVITCLVNLGNGRFLSGDSDHVLHVWCFKTNKHMHVLRGHHDGVWCADGRGKYAVSGSCDRDVRVWDVDRGLCINVLRGHTSTVRCVALTETHVISGSRDKTVRVWDPMEGTCLRVLRGHTDSVRCLAWSDKYVVSGSYDATAIVWDNDSFMQRHVLDGHATRIYSIELSGDRVVTGSLDTTIRVWDALTGTCQHVLQGHTQLTIAMTLSGNTLFSANADNTLRVWDLEAGTCKLVLSSHYSSISGVVLRKNAIFSCSKDGTIRVWDRNTGQQLYVLADFLPSATGVSDPPLTLRTSGRCTVWQMVATETQLVAAVGVHNASNAVDEAYLAVFDVLPWAISDVYPEVVVPETSPSPSL